MKSQRSIKGKAQHHQVLDLKSWAQSLLGALTVLLLTGGTSWGHASPVKAENLSVPSSLAKITGKNEGSREQLFVLIAETHVSLKVQRNVADLLSYLHGAYGMNLVCTEGTDSFPDMAFWRT